MKSKKSTKVESAKSKVESVSLGSVASFDRTAAILKERNGLAYISLEDIDSTNGSIRIVERADPKSTKFAFSPEHVLYGKLRPNLRKVARPDFSGICSTDIIPIRPSKRLDRDYLFHFLRIPAVTRLATQFAVGINLPRRSPKQLSTFDLPLPTFKAQRRIAEVLDRADALRAKRRAALAQLDELTQSLVLHMFGDPVTNPKKLRKVSLGELIKLKSGEFLPASGMAEAGPYPVFGGNGMNGYHDQFMFETPQVIIGRVGVYCGCVHVSPPRSWVTDNALYVNERGPDVDVEYLAHSLRFARLNQYASQSGQPLVSGTRIYPVQILVPSLPLQREFAQRMQAVEQLKMGHLASLSELDTLFASLQHRAFRGEL